MANENVTSSTDGLPLEEVLVSEERRSKYYDINVMLGQTFLKSSKFSMRLYNNAGVLSDFDISTRDLSFLCDSIEFPGQALTTSDYRIPGKLKIKVPYLRELNEVTVTFYHNNKIPLYEYFSTWIQSISPTNTENQYFQDIVADIEIVQFDETSGVRGFIRDLIDFNRTPLGGLNQNLSKYMTVDLKNVYPINFTSMPANWADDGFHKMTVTFFYENLEINQNAPNLKFKDLLDNGNIYDATTVRPLPGNFA